MYLQDTFLAFLDHFMERLHRQGSRPFRLKLSKAEALLRQLVPHINQPGGLLQSKAADTAITYLQHLEALTADHRSAAQMPPSDASDEVLPVQKHGP